jgi:hypothetical protein
MEHTDKYDSGLEAHHIVKSRDGGGDYPENFITVCRSCHATLEKTQSKGLSEIKRSEKTDDFGLPNPRKTVRIGDTWEKTDLSFSVRVVDIECDVATVDMEMHSDAEIHAAIVGSEDKAETPCIQIYDYNTFIDEFDRDAHHYTEWLNQQDEWP